MQLQDATYYRGEYYKETPEKRAEKFALLESIGFKKNNDESYNVSWFELEYNTLLIRVTEINGIYTIRTKSKKPKGTVTDAYQYLCTTLEDLKFLLFRGSIGNVLWNLYKPNQENA